MQLNLALELPQVLINVIDYRDKTAWYSVGPCKAHLKFERSSGLTYPALGSGEEHSFASSSSVSNSTQSQPKASAWCFPENLIVTGSKKMTSVFTDYIGVNI